MDNVGNGLTASANNLMTADDENDFVNVFHEDSREVVGDSRSDHRFLCAMCLETVSDEPVVTRCGHLYCWSCLYRWLEPGMLLSEYRAAFGDPGDFHAANRPYNPRGVIYDERRRCCPVCKAFCTVDSVVPIYVHVPSDEDSRVAAVDPWNARPTRNHEGPMEVLHADSNLGIRQRRRTATSAIPRHSPRQNSCDSPMHRHDILGEFDHLTNDDHATPVRRNGNAVDDLGDDATRVSSTWQGMPSRPVPTSTWPTA